eukprot:TRINITY_DN7113_c0_g1_i6.p1 TRINITY_DN7113_c0_g1~~TRINITY_DN7113_c0_g1_i6.p1  ORF type:complete len:205 (-),score=10.78 TRINITY_DN7113_c0_g1_i6:43-657(-)
MAKRGVGQQVLYFFFFQAEDGIRDHAQSRGLGDVYKRQILKGLIKESEFYDFTMCNPPFFEDDTDKAGLSRGTVSTSSESICEGGEIAFVKSMIEEGFLHRKQLGFMSSMFGKKDSSKWIESYLRVTYKNQVTIESTEFRQGRTARWGVAWRWHDLQQIIKQNILVFARVLANCTPCVHRSKAVPCLTVYYIQYGSAVLESSCS